MTRKPAAKLKTEKALLQYIFTRAHELSVAIEVSATKDARHITRFRRSVDALLKCADLVSEIDGLAKNVSPSAQLLTEATYSALSVGQLQTLGYLNLLPVRGTILLPGLPPIGIQSVPTSSGYEISLDGPAHRQLLLESTGTSFGGNRWWFVCGGVATAICGRRVLKMYRREGQDFFACRDCHRSTDDHGWRSAKDRAVGTVMLQPATVTANTRDYPDARSA